MNFLESSAVFSPGRAYRYLLKRVWDRSLPLLGICGLNPSAADETEPDPTITRETGFAASWGFGGLVKGNICALVSTDPKGLRTVLDPVGPENDNYLGEAIYGAHMFVAAWGALSGAPSWLRRRADQVLRRAAAARDVYCFRITAKGMPEHPLYLPRNLKPTLYRAGRSAA